MTDICSICFEQHNSSSIKLFCGHCLHKECLYRIYNHPNLQLKCPLCRENIDIDFIENLFGKKNCKICNIEINKEENNMNNVYLMDCQCKFHYKCWKNFLENTFPSEINNPNFLPNNPTISCPYCQKIQPYYNINSRDYSYLFNGHILWIGDLESCKRKYCIYDGNPQRYGYCGLHGKKKASNRAIKNTLRFFVKVGPHWSYEKKMDNFYKILQYCDKNDLNMDIDIPTITQNIS